MAAVGDLSVEMLRNHLSIKVGRSNRQSRGNGEQSFVTSPKPGFRRHSGGSDQMSIHVTDSRAPESILLDRSDYRVGICNKGLRQETQRPHHVGQTGNAAKRYLSEHKGMKKNGTLAQQAAEHRVCFPEMIDPD
jgi:hypothetical protein